MIIYYDKNTQHIKIVCSSVWKSSTSNNNRTKAWIEFCHKSSYCTACSFYHLKMKLGNNYDRQDFRDCFYLKSGKVVILVEDKI